MKQSSSLWTISLFMMEYHFLLSLSFDKTCQWQHVLNTGISHRNEGLGLYCQGCSISTGIIYLDGGLGLYSLGYLISTGTTYLDGGLGLYCLGCFSLSCSSSIAAIADIKYPIPNIIANAMNTVSTVMGSMLKKKIYICSVYTGRSTVLDLPTR